jgi:peptide-methionine (R)-S-oxide reductase
MSERHYERRAFLLLVFAGSGGYAFWKRSAPPESSLPARVRIAGFDSRGRATGVTEVETVRRSDDEWKRLLPLDSYWVTRRRDTELAFMGRYHNFDGDGLYRCVCCDTALFDSRDKYASGTGWPAFTAPIAKENVVEKPDATFGIAQTEVRCRRCDAHLGHLFDDGPPPAGLRYCINSGALRFVARGV